MIVQIVAASHPELVRSLVLTNCDTEGNFPPKSFMPVIKAARRGQIEPLLTVAAADPAAARMVTGRLRRLVPSSCNRHWGR